MANEYAVNHADLTAIADAIRSKKETSAAIAFPDEFVSAIQSIESGLWGGKMITGSFTLAEDSTGEYVIAEAGDSVIQGLLYDGETFSQIHGKVALLVMRDGTSEFNAENYPGTMGAALRVVTKTGSYHSMRQYWNSSGSSNTQGGGTTIDANKIAVTFASGCAGSAAFTYNWAAWRHV